MLNIDLFLKNLSPGELKKKYSDDDKLPVKSFIYMEKIAAIKLILCIDENLKAIQGFVTGSMLLSEEIQKLATQLINQQVGVIFRCLIYFKRLAHF